LAATSVSVVIPVFNGEGCLAEAIESALVQDHPDVEVIVVDDGSTDQTAAVVRSYEGVRYLRQENAGAGAARNAGVAAARGTYVAFSDADDVLLPHRLSAQAQVLDDDPAIGCVLGRHLFVVPHGEDPPPWLARDTRFGDLGGVEAGAAMIRTGLVRRVPWDSRYALGEGIEWLTHLRREGVRVEVLDVPVYERRWRGDNLSADRDGLRSEVLSVLKLRIDEQRAQAPNDG
jgi:glycosyltransferase involved in cell wall biosynthesis